MIIHTPATTHYGTAGLVWVHGTPLLLRMHRIVLENYFERAVAHCTGADARLHLTQVSRDPLFTLSMRWDDGRGGRRTVLTAMTDSGRVSTAILVRMQRRWRRRLEEDRQRRLRHLALAMGSHAHLGKDSPLYAIDGDLLPLIAALVRC